MSGAAQHFNEGELVCDDVVDLALLGSIRGCEVSPLMEFSFLPNVFGIFVTCVPFFMRPVASACGWGGLQSLDAVGTSHLQANLYSLPWSDPPDDKNGGRTSGHGVKVVYNR